jgi:hypothetical protein
MVASDSASASAPAPVLTHFELVNKTHFQWFLTQVSTYVDEMWRRCSQPKLSAGALVPSTTTWADILSSAVKIHTARRLWASRGIQINYKPCRGVIAKLTGIVD